MVQGDRDLITQVIYNLLENAAKFAAPQSTLYLGLAVNGEKAYVTVRNQGQTIPAEEILCCSSGSTSRTSPAARTRTATAWGCTSSRPF